MKLLTGKAFRFSALEVIFLTGLFTAPNSILLSAEPNEISKPSQKISGGYCGVYCLYGAMRFLWRDCEPNELIKTEYIGSSKGSSLAELKKAAVDHGLYATPVKRLTTKDLRGISIPVIIHVKSHSTGESYDHYELFLGAEQGEALIYDPPNPVESVPFATLAQKWDGSALIVSDKPIDLGALFAPARKRFAVYTAIAIAIVLAVRWGRKRFFSNSIAMNRKKVFWSGFGQCAILVFIATTSAFIYHSTGEEGLLVCREATALVQQAHRANFIPKISDRIIRRLVADGKAVFIDPRPDYIFKTGHFKDAINISPGATDDSRVTAMNGIDKNAMIIVYCQRPNYRQAGDLAVKLSNDGFSNVRIYKGNRIQ